MNQWLHIDWAQAFTFSVSPIEIVIRGTIVYLAVFTLLRVILKREAGSLGVTDLLVVVLLGDASQNAMANDHKSIPDGLLLVATIIFWAFALDWLGFKSKWFQKILEPPTLELVKDGKINHRNMRRELITRDELMSALRLEGMTELKEVKRACMESDGSISIVKNDEEEHKAPERKSN
ncbi:MAG: YetF domain-containing protein [Capsulimonas sp.]|uniref:DUF421 domain-containing protein n=1 Tax=Capsulimonas sp. TaxID=2494211 RepID=UPI0032634BF3